MEYWITGMQVGCFMNADIKNTTLNTKHFLLTKAVNEAHFTEVSSYHSLSGQF